MTAPTNYEIGSTLIEISDMVTAGIIYPQAEYNEGTDTVTLGSGQQRRMGLPFANWTFGYLTQAQYDALRAFCTSASAVTYIATINNDNEFKRYAGIMQMPERYTIRDSKYLDVQVTITHLVEQEEA